MRRSVAVGALIVALTACASDDDTSISGTSSETSPSTSTTSVALHCPVDDPAFCEAASDVRDALLAGDAAAVVELSRPDTIDCSEVAREYFPGCAEADVLEGHGRRDAGLTVELVDTDEYTATIAELLAAIDPSYEDELGDGSMQLIGVGTCGPDEPGRRTYHLAWTAAPSGTDGGAATRVLGSFEFGSRSPNDEWRITLTYVDTLEAWESAQADPLRAAFCAAGRSPWP